MITVHQNPKQLVRDQIDKMLLASVWEVQCKKQSSVAAGVGVAVKEDQSGDNSADYILFVNRKLIGVIEARRRRERVACLIRRVGDCLPWF